MNPIRALLHRPSDPPPSAFTRTEDEYQEVRHHARKWEERAKKNHQEALKAQTRQHQAEAWRLKAQALEKDNHDLTNQLLTLLKQQEERNTTK